MLLEGELLGGRITMSFFDGDVKMGGYDASTSMTYFSCDLYLRHALAENLYVYGGVGLSKLEYDTNTPTGRGSTMAITSGANTPNT